MAQMPDSEFASFLDIDLDLGFYDADAHSKQPQQHSSDQVEQQNAVFDFSMPLDVQFSMAQQQQSHAHHIQSVIPPTPNSVEMHSDTAQYLQHMEAQQRAIIDQYHLKRPQTSFTPTTSPVVNANYTVPGSYFSPLTSPALDAQPYSYQSHPSASSVATSSPVDLDVGMPDVGVTQQMNSAMKSRKRTNAARLNNAAQNSPATRPHRGRRSNLSVSMAENEAREMIQDGLRSTAPMSATDSVSPEPLNDSSMPPPHRPASATPSPALLAKPSALNSQRHGPATPASLMKMQQAKNSPRSVVIQSPGMSSDVSRDPMLPPLSLPEAAAGMTMAIDPELSSADHESATTSRKTPKLGPLSTPSGSITPTATLSRTSTSATNSPLTSSFPSSRKSDPKGRTKKTRGSISNNTLVSPALRPKISPSIKPLLPEGGSGDDAHTVFLASRSNYQNLIEGTHVPGVSYPTELSTNLTSKRTSHKIAEQGRRNRINLALQEMLRLLPRSSGRNAIEAPSPKEDESGKKSDGKGSGNSKAATVESAIEYIKALQSETQEMSKVAEAKDKECEELRKKLKEMEKLIGEKGVSVPTEEEDEDSSEEDDSKP